MCKRHYYKFMDAGLIRSLLVDATPTKQRIEQHLERNRPMHDLADLTGVEPNTVKWIREGTQRRVQERTARRILAVPLPPTAVGTARRIRALDRMGWPRHIQVRECGLSDATLRTAAQGGLVRARTAVAVAEMYKRLGREQGPSRVAAATAAYRGYPSPAAWDDNIDDPAAEPLGVGGARCRRDYSAQARYEEIQFLESFGVHDELIAKQLGLSCKTLGTVRARARAAA